MSTALAYGLGKYPITGGDKLRSKIARWLTRRFQLPFESINPNKHILPVNGTREALFAFAQCVVDTRASKPLVLNSQSVLSNL
jgi:N-succinyldiaminopimelate aminotransferase